MIYYSYPLSSMIAALIARFNDSFIVSNREVKGLWQEKRYKG